MRRVLGTTPIDITLIRPSHLANQPVCQRESNLIRHSYAAHEGGALEFESSESDSGSAFVPCIVVTCFARTSLLPNLLSQYGQS